MIVRQWRAWTAPGRETDYLDYFTAVTLPELRSIRGFHGASVLRRPDGDAVEITVLTRWESADALRTWAGEDPTSAVIYPETIDAVDRFDNRVVHFDLLHEG